MTFNKLLNASIASLKCISNKILAQWIPRIIVQNTYIKGISIIQGKEVNNLKGYITIL